MQKLIATMAAVVAAALPANAFLATQVQGQAYPSRPITVVMPFAAGGPGDVIARVVGQSMSGGLGQSILVENTAGAGGTIGAARVAAARADGYTLLLTHIGMATGPALYASLKYDAIKDFEPIGLVADHPMVFVARKEFPAQDFSDFLAYAKASGDKLTYGHAGVGSASHLCGALLQGAIGREIRGVPYRGAGLALNDVISGQIDFMCDQPVNVIGNASTGAIKAYAVTATERQPALPTVPTVAAHGYANLVVTIWNGLYAPKGTPQEAVDKLASALQAAMIDPAVKTKLSNLGVDLMSKERASPQGLRNHLAAETARWVPLLKSAGVVPQ